MGDFPKNVGVFSKNVGDFLKNVGDFLGRVVEIVASSSNSFPSFQRENISIVKKSFKHPPHACARTRTTEILRFLLSQPSPFFLQYLVCQWIMRSFRTFFNKRRIATQISPYFLTCERRPFVLHFFQKTKDMVKVVKAKKWNYQGMRACVTRVRENRLNRRRVIVLGV